MSHVHYINGQLETADRYQAFLEQTKAVRLAEKKERARKRSGTRAFETAIDADEDDEEEAQEEAGGSREDAPQEPRPEAAQDPGIIPGDAAGPIEGFGQHYA